MRDNKATTILFQTVPERCIGFVPPPLVERLFRNGFERPPPLSIVPYLTKEDGNGEHGSDPTATLRPFGEPKSNHDEKGANNNKIVATHENMYKPTNLLAIMFVCDTDCLPKYLNDGFTEEIVEIRKYDNTGGEIHV